MSNMLMRELHAALEDASRKRHAAVAEVEKFEGIAVGWRSGVRHAETGLRSLEAKHRLASVAYREFTEPL